MNDQPDALCKRRPWTLTRALIVGFGLILLVAVGVVLAFSLSSGLATTRDLISERAVVMVSSIRLQTREYLAPARNQAESVAALIEARTLDPDNRISVVTALRHSLAAAPQLETTYYVPADLRNVIEVNRDAAGAKVQDWREFDVAQDAIRELAQAETGFWADVVYSETANRTVLNYRRPITHNGKFVGAVVTAVATAELSMYLRELVAGQPVTAFILVGEHSVLAHTDADQWQVALSESAPMPDLSEAGDPVLAQLWSGEERELRGFEKYPDHRGVRLKVDGDEHALFFQQAKDQGDTTWVYGVHTRAHTVLAAFKRLLIAGISGLVVLALAMVGVFLLGRRLSRPVLTLARAATDVSARGPHSIEALPGSRISEIDQASRAFDAMVSGLREREQMRDTLGRYVPSGLVDQLIGEGGVLGPQTRETTTLFTDIVGFSSVSESMSPTELIEMLNEYFAVVAEPIEAHGGVIHQFQGDAILATFNSPTALIGHQAHAVRAALEIQSVVLSRRFGGGVELATRIGINTGEAVCGTVGSDSRLGFTVHGDEVKLAARVEQMNKSLGTRVLVAEATVRAVHEEFEFMRVGVMPVRGRQADVVVYTVQGPHNESERPSLQSAS